MEHQLQAFLIWSQKDEDKERDVYNVTKVISSG